MGRPQKAIKINPEELSGTLARIELRLKELDAQSKTIIQLLADLRKEQSRTQVYLEDQISLRIEKLRKDVRDGIAALVTSDGSGTALDIAKDFVFNQAKTRPQK